MTDIPTSGGTFAWNCRDCSFIGHWLTVDGRCPRCGGRDLPTQTSINNDSTDTSLEGSA